jgi:hypothetical protein
MSTVASNEPSAATAAGMPFTVTLAMPISSVAVPRTVTDWTSPEMVPRSGDVTMRPGAVRSVGVSSPGALSAQPTAASRRPGSRPGMATERNERVADMTGHSARAGPVFGQPAISDATGRERWN